MENNEFNLEKLKKTRKIFCVAAACLITTTGWAADIKDNLSYARTIQLTLNTANKALKDVFKEIEQNSDFVIFYYEGAVDANRLVNVEVKNQTVDKILDQLFAGTDNDYNIVDKQIYITKKAVKIAQTAEKLKIQREVTGRVVDELGEALPGVAIQVKGTTRGVTTDLDGAFAIEADNSDVLVFSFLGMQNQELVVGNKKVVFITMKEDTEELEEVVVTAFGVGQKKESVVGSIVQVKPSELKVPSANLSNSFAGRLAGVTSFQRGGEPGQDGASFYIRGISTINEAARAPLIVIDGVEASKADLNALDPEVIDGFSILKDATATAMYGTRGANGVMIVTTKSGANMEKAAINIRVEGNVAMPTKIPKFVDAPSYMSMFNEATTNYGVGSVLYTPEQIEATRNGVNPYLYPNVDWYNELFNTATFNQRANFNVRGGSKRIDYFMNVNVNHESGMLKDRSKEFYSYGNNINIMRYTFQNNLNLNINKDSKLSLNLGVELRDSNGPATDANDLFGTVMKNNPVEFPTFYPVGSFVGKEGMTSDYMKWGYTENSDAGNPLAELVKGYKDSFTSTVRANLRYTHNLDIVTKGLKFGALVSFKNWSSTSRKRTRGYNKYYLQSPVYDENNELTNVVLGVRGQEQNYNLGTETETTGDRSFYIQGTLNYDRTFDKLHNVSAMLLYNQDEWNTNNAKNELIASLPKRKIGFAARLSYDYDHRYMAEVNMGYNGSENFAKGKRFGFFPSLALGWNVSQESWFNNNVVHNLKLRGSYGLVGNADAGTRFLYLPVVDLDGSGSWVTGDGESSQSLKGPVYSRFKNDNITWEIGYKTNVGIDVGLFHSLNLSLDYFNELRTDIFQENKTVPNYLGTAKSKIYGNYGEVKNEGFEIALDYGKQFNKDLSIQMKGTFSFARNKVRKYAQASSFYYPNLNIVGESLSKHLGYIYAGHLFGSTEEIGRLPEQMISGNIAPGDIIYLDIPNVHGETDGIINDNDRRYMGYPTVPEIIYGFGPSVTWKRFDFSMFFQGVANTSLMMSGFHPFGKYDNRNVLQFIADDYYNEETQNVNASYPRLTKLDHGNNTVGSSYWLRNGAFLKLKNLEIGYSYKVMRVYVNGSNLLTFSPFKHWDPEMGGGSGLKYPTQRVVNLGIQLSL